ncbi:MAG: XdhC family protein [Pirellulaceae bacterium]
MHDLIAKLIERVGQGRAVAFCQLVETRGSTPQKPGAAMLVEADGSQHGTLGGGCVEAEVKRRAIAALETSGGRLVDFLLDSDYGWDDGLICGGRMRVLIEPLPVDSDITLFQTLRTLLDAGHGGTLAIELPPPAELPKETRPPRERLVAGEGSEHSPGIFLLDPQGKLIATRRHGGEGGPSGPNPEEDLIPLSDRPKPYLAGGFAYLPILPRCRLVIVGGGHIGKAVAELAAQADFNVTVVDDREEVVSEERFPTASQRISGEIGEVLSELKTDRSTFGLIVTRGHQHDELALYHLIQKELAFLGMIGSKRKIKLIFDDLEEKGIAPEKLRQVFAPVGLDIGSQTVMEIAISITAQLIAQRNQPGKKPA